MATNMAPHANGQYIWPPFLSTIDASNTFLLKPATAMDLLYVQIVCLALEVLLYLQPHLTAPMDDTQ
jgi:hypothetical protein